MSNYSSQFRAVQTPSGKKAFEAWTAVWIHCGRELAISAPTLEELKAAWERMVVDPALNIEKVQHVWIVSAGDRT